MIYDNKSMRIGLFLLFVSVCLGVRPPAPTCRVAPLPTMLPLTVGQTLKLDLENIFDGYNLEFSAPLPKDHISLVPKYQVNQKTLNESMNFTAARIKDHDRFLGLSSHNSSTTLVVGTNDNQTGVTIEHTVHIEDVQEMQCYDVDEVHHQQSGKVLAIIDCAVFKNGTLHKNQFVYVDLDTYKPVLGTSEHDNFVKFTQLKKRNIETLTDPFNHVNYLLRFITSDQVDEDHANQTYVEIFMWTDSPLAIRLLDVIDHTVLELDALSIYDYQVHFNLIYILVKGLGLYQFTVTPTQHLQLRSFMQINMDVTQFRVEQLGFNDDLLVAFSNDNTIYQFEWDVTTPPTLITKYALMPGSQVQDMHMDGNFIIIHAVAEIDDKPDRRTWIFSRRTLSYTNAFGSFEAPMNSPAIIQWRGYESMLHIFEATKTYNIRVSLPYLKISPVSSQMAGQTEQFLVKAKSTEGQLYKDCQEKLNLIYIENTNSSVFKTGLMRESQIYVDSPDEKQIQLLPEFFGPFLEYNVTFDSESFIHPHSYIDKKHKAVFQFPPEINPEQIAYFEMFIEKEEEERIPSQVYGLIQIKHQAAQLPDYTTQYIRCDIKVMDSDEIHHLNCRLLHSMKFSMGKIVKMSQMFDPQSRKAAILFETKPSTVFIFEFRSETFVQFGNKTFDNVYTNQLSDVEINKNLVMVCFELGKRIEVYRVEEFHSTNDQKVLFTINSSVMSFFGVNYFSPVDMKVSIHHDEVLFVRTKTGVMAININQQGLPELLFHLPTSTPNYSFEVNYDTIMILTEKYCALYRMDRPLRRSAPPYLLNKFDNISTYFNYGEINSDGFFYVVNKDTIYVINPYLPATSVLYTQEKVPGVQMIDAVQLQGKEILFAFDGKDMFAYVLSHMPKLYVDWTPNAHNFTLNITGYNSKAAVQEPYSLTFNVLESVETEIKPTQSFNESTVRALGHVGVDVNVESVDVNVTIDDRKWFTGTIVGYNISCEQCNKSESKITIQNPVAETREVIASKAMYDVQSTVNGIYVQQYDSVIKTFPRNDSVELYFTIPTGADGEACTKLALPSSHDFVLSFCELGTEVNMFLTSLVSTKPFTMGPYLTDARSVNHVKIEGDILILVDNDDNPYVRSGGVYLYRLHADHTLPKPITMLDYLDYADLQIEGYEGMPYIASADIKKVLFNREEYTIFLTEARTGNLFVFTFEVSSDGNQVVYLHRKMIPLSDRLPKEVPFPQPLRTMSVHIMDYTVKSDASKVTFQYILLFTVKNWHHLEVEITLSDENDVLFFKLVRLFERVPYPFELVNYMKIKKGHLNASYFAVSYIEKDERKQLLAIYQLPRYRLNETEDYEGPLYEGIPITRMLGAHQASEISEIAYDFSLNDDHKMLFIDTHNANISELEVNKQVKIIVKGANPREQKPQNITVTAFNPYTKFSFDVELSFEDSKEAERMKIVWIIILIVGFAMIAGLVIVWVKQVKSDRKEPEEGRESLLTETINRTSTNPNEVPTTMKKDSKHSEEEDDGEQNESDNGQDNGQEGGQESGEGENSEGGQEDKKGPQQEQKQTKKEEEPIQM